MSLSRRPDLQLLGVVTLLARAKFATTVRVGLSAQKGAILGQVRGHFTKWPNNGPSHFTDLVHFPQIHNMTRT